MLVNQGRGQGRLYSSGLRRPLRSFQKSARQFLNPVITDIPMSPELTAIVEWYRKKKESGG